MGRRASARRRNVWHEVPFNTLRGLALVRQVQAQMKTRTSGQGLSGHELNTWCSCCATAQLGTLLLHKTSCRRPRRRSTSHHGPQAPARLTCALWTQNTCTLRLLHTCHFACTCTINKRVDAHSKVHARICEYPTELHTTCTHKRANTDTCLRAGISIPACHFRGRQWARQHF